MCACLSLSHYDDVYLLITTIHSTDNFANTTKASSATVSGAEATSKGGN